MRAHEIFAFAAPLIMIAAAPVKAEALTVSLDHARTVKVTSGWSMVVVGNPAIADVKEAGDETLIIIGKAYGSTNIMALDEGGDVVTSMVVTVVAPRARNEVTLYRGARRSTLACAPECQPAPRLGDDPAQYEALVDLRAKAAAQSEDAGQPD